MKPGSTFDKFVNKKKNSVVKETFRQEKKKAKKERAAYFENLKAEQYQARLAKKQAAQELSASKKNNPKGKTAPVKQVVSSVAASKPNPKAIEVKTAQPASGQEKPLASMPLNKYIAHCGICSRRDAVTLIADGKVKVNGKPCTEPGYKVLHHDEITFNNKRLSVTKNLQYILLNKPKDYITTSEDPQGRKTVLQLIQHATIERVYPVGRLDRNTSGVLLLTNDGDLTQKLSHPKFNVRKIYEARLDKPLTKTDFEKILKGLILEDGPIQVDGLAYADAKDKSIIGIEIHSGRNRIVRRIFEHLGYDVKGLDRVMYAGLTKKNVERGKWRFLNEREIRQLKYLNQSHKKKATGEA
jgi:23S rRNA pseudouridine2605 synthase